MVLPITKDQNQGADHGRGAALLYAARGALVYAADLSPMGLERPRAWRAKQGELRTAIVDVAQEDEIAALLARTGRAAGQLGAAFDNAGIIGGHHRIEDYPADGFARVLGVNLRSVFLGMKYQIPLLLRQGGTIVNTLKRQCGCRPPQPARCIAGCWWSTVA